MQKIKIDVDQEKLIKILKAILSVIILGVIICAVITDKKWYGVLVVAILAVIDIVLLYVPNKLNDNLNKWLSYLMFIGTPVFVFQVVETFNWKLLFKYDALRNFGNIFIYTMIMLFAYIIFNSIRGAVIFTNVSMFLYAAANYYVYTFRGSPILATDIASFRTAANVAANYSYTPPVRMLLLGLGVTAYCIIISRLKVKQGLELKKRLCLLGIYMFVLIGVGYDFYTTERIVEKGVIVSVWNPQRSFKKNGTILSFMVTSKYIKVEKPEGYSLEAVDEIVNNYTELSDDASQAAQKPNVIAIMDEAFADLKLNGEFETSEDYMPFINSLEEDTIKGVMYTSVFGGNTANTEFEFLTGNTLGFLPLRCVPYQQYIKNPLSSLTYILKHQGYIGMKAVHPYDGSGWARETTYPLLGFEDFISIEDWDTEYYNIRKYMSDESSFDKIINEYEKTRQESNAPFYLFNVTMQNHGGYDEDYDTLERSIKIVDEHKDDEGERYINLVKKTDEAFEKLVTYFEQVDEPTVIVFFGDHQPSVHTKFYNKIMEKEEGMSDEEFAMQKYRVPFVIWANYDIEEKEYEMLSANYISSVLLEAIGAKMPGYNKFLLDVSKSIPVITANGYYDINGKFYDRNEVSEEFKDILSAYEIVEYNNMLDIKNRRNDFFFLENVQY